MSWSEVLKQTAYRAELERKTVHSAGNEEQFLARLQREHALTQTELQATRRCIEEAVVVRLEPHRSAQAEISLHGSVVAGRSVSCGVKTNFEQDTTFTLDSHPEGGSAANVSSASTVTLMTARRGTQPATTESHSHADAARAPAAAPCASTPQVRGMSLPTGLLDSELGALSAAGSSKTSNSDSHKEQSQRQLKAQSEQHTMREKLWQPENPLKHVSMRAAFPLGAGARGGWRLGLSQRINEYLSIDAKLRGGSSRLSGGGGKITIVDLSADQSMQSMCSTGDAAVRRRTLGRPSGGQIRVELQQPVGWKCSLTLNSNAQGPTLECRWRGHQASQPSEAHSRTPRPAEPDAEQTAAERGRQWHSWHLSRVELPAWQRAMNQSLPSIEARATMKGLCRTFSNLQASMFMPL
ncbi:g6024 [Coccomyxa viridis]|uniref:G6024 protein n=1 Tax=Coccomyxa viridis TaxID=1274662 RepID=A0ABP1FZ83_9CHLO